MLQKALAGLDSYRDPNVLVGYETADDAGVYLLDEKKALVQTIDFFTPIVDDPYVYGQIAAANALSDIYAMGGEPRFALSVVAFPDNLLDESVLRETLQGGSDKMREAAVSVIGGHSVRDMEMKFGYAVTGFVSPGRIYRNSGSRPGDVLVLTKPIGTGILASAIKFGTCPRDVAEEAIEWMLKLNRSVSESLQEFPIHAVTDITGYGLIGHAYEMALCSGVCLVFTWESIPLLRGVPEVTRKGNLPGGIEANRRFVGNAVCWNGLDKPYQQMLLDPQTSGGLLLSVQQEEADRLVKTLEQKGEMAAVVGRAVSREEAYIRID